MKTILRILMNFFYKVKVDVAPESQNVHGVIVCNHQSFLDGLLLGIYLPQNPVFVIDRNIAKRWYFKIFLRYVDHVTVDTLHPMTIKFLVREVEKGRTIVVFPEGRITLTGSFMKFYEGAAFVAFRAKVPLIPVFLDGAEFTCFSRLKGLVKRKLFTPITITTLPPITIETPEGLFGRERRQYLAKYTHRVMMDTRLQVFKPKTIFESVLLAKKQFGGDTVCVEDINRVPENYDQFISKSLGVGRALTHHTQVRQRVGVILPNAIGSAAAVLGLSALGRVPAMLNYTAGVEGLRAALVAADIKTILTSRVFLEKAKLLPIIEQFNDIHWLFAEDIKKNLSLSDKLWVVKVRRNPLKYLPVMGSDSEAIILFTSGSEGKPKGVVHSHTSILTNIEQVRTVADFTVNDCFMVALPLFHAFGLTAGLFLPLISGGKAFFYPTPLHYRIIPEVIYDIQATVLFGTSTFLQHYARFANPYDFASLRYVVAGAEKLSETVREHWMDKYGIRILEGYGVTECSPVVSINVPMNYKEGSVGQLLPQIEAKLIPVEGVAQGGKLVIKGGNIMLGYLLFDQPGVLQLTEYAGAFGWYDTGDIVAIDHDRFVSIKGRAKRFAKIAGEMVSLEVAESLFIKTYPEGLHAAVIRKDSAKGEAVVVFTTKNDYERAEVAAMARSLGVSELAVARDVRPIEALPLLGTGKVDYVTLTAMAAEEEQ